MARNFILQKAYKRSMLQSSIFWDNDKFRFRSAENQSKNIKDKSSHSDYFHSIYGNCGNSNQECIGGDLEKRILFVLGPKYMIINRIDKSKVEIEENVNPEVGARLFITISEPN